MRSMWALLSVAWASISLAATWTLTTADFAQRSGELVSIDAQGVEVRQAGAQRIPWRDVVSLVQDSPAPPQAQQPFLLATRDGQLLSGKPTKIADEKVQWESQALGSLQVPLEQVRGVTRVGSTFPASAGEDIAVLRNADVVRGVVDSADADGLVIQKGADKSTIRWEALSVLLLADVGGASPTSVKSLRVRLTDGSTCLATQAKVDGVELRLQREKGEELRLPAASVVAIENLAGRAKFLQTLQPSTRQYAPYFQPATVSEGIRFSDDPQLRSVIELRPRATLTYVAPVAGTLHFRYACADAGQLTDMTLQVSSGDKTLLRQESIGMATQPKAVDLPVQSGQPITILLDYGKNYDVQNTLRLLDAAFVEKP